MTSNLQTPVLFLIFNRPETTWEVFAAIRQAQPPRLYVAGDGPRSSRPGEAAKVLALRSEILAGIDWPCVVHTRFQNQNLGCKQAVSSAISWFFEQEERGIVLEDDCVPSQSFFGYCEEMLEHFAHDPSVYMIAGEARGPESFGMTEDLALCKYALVWGWASWARVWRQYDVQISDWPQQKKRILAQISTHPDTRRFWRSRFNALYARKIDTWDYQLTYLMQKNQAKCVVPGRNLITNIGFGAEATHTFDLASNSANRPRFELDFPINTLLNPASEQKINAFYDASECRLLPLHQRAVTYLTRKLWGKSLH